ncbi:hypothetical protein FRC03_006883 [Tulasnella sp. 419]|nr:hypothetical protein FRC02_007737 [Tulasnella sp. 418]KAG8960227.1 hypothetical protein FRC03_006883 [Tulasnella sp. 419]
MSSKTPLLPSQGTSKPAQDSKPRGPNRSTKTAHKLKVLPEQPEQPATTPTTEEGERGDGSASGDNEDNDIEDDEEDDAPVYKQIAQIPAGAARKDALRLNKKQKAKLPRVTAYCTATSYRMADLMKFFMARKEAYHTAPKEFDQVIYTPYSYDSSSPKTRPSVLSRSRSPSDHPQEGDLLGVPDLLQPPNGEDNHPNDHRLSRRENQESSGHETLVEELTITNKGKSRYELDQGAGSTAEVFLFEYGTVVIWGMTEAQERRFLSSLRKFEVERLATEDIEMEDLNYYYANYSRIYNDVITLRKGSSFMTKLSLSHALAQSVKISLFEELIANTIDQTKDIPEIIAETGKIGMPINDIMQQIGQLFILRMNINLVGSVLDSPELFWSYPDLQPLYDAARSYLEIPQRVDLLNARVEVLHDMLRLLKESVSSRHAERLEQIVIFLIGIEILLGIATIAIDLFSSYFIGV